MKEVPKQPNLHIKSLITFVEDRAGHDRRYAIDASKLEKNLVGKQMRTLIQGL